MTERLKDRYNERGWSYTERGWSYIERGWSYTERAEEGHTEIRGGESRLTE